MFQLDMKKTFLQDELKDEVYIKQPPGYVAQEENMVCKLKKAIYDLKSSLRAWFDKFSHIIFEVGVQNC